MIDDDWRLKANCKGRPEEWFEHIDGDTEHELRFTLATEVCLDCPVFFECKDDATEDDLTWTVRAGEIPKATTLFPPQFKEKKTKKSGPLHPRICNKGHDVPNGGRCLPCRRAANAALKLARKAQEGVS